MKKTIETAVSAAESEFTASRWAVVSFEECAASGLSYDEAARLVRQMSESISGLCIVTEEAANRLGCKRQTNGNQSALITPPKNFAETL